MVGDDESSADAHHRLSILWLRPDKPDNISVGRHRIARELEQSGHSVDVWNTTLASFRDILSERPDVIVGTTRLGALVGTWKHVIHGTPLVVDHIDPIAQFRRNSGPVRTWVVKQLEQLAFRAADHVLVVYEEELERVETYASAVTKTELGVDYDSFANPPEAVLERARQHLHEVADSERKTVVYVGGLEPAYNIRTIIEAMDHLDGWQFLVLGDGSLRETVERIASHRDDVVYPGTVPHDSIPGYLHAADVGISLVDDRNTLKLLEYGAARLPAVSIAGDPEAKFGGLVEFCENDPLAVARALQRATEGAPVDDFQEFTREFGWAAIAEEYLSVIRAAIDERGVTPPK